MKAYETPNGLTIRLEERLEALQAADAEKELLRLVREHPGQAVCLDAQDLRYISSSGLRALMTLRKALDQNLVIRNVSPEVYEVFDLTGFLMLMDIRRKMREIDVSGCPVIGRGAFGTVYRLNDDTVVKVYPGGEAYYDMIRREQDLAKQAFVRGIPTAIPFDIVQVGDCYGTVFEMVNAKSCIDLIREDPARFDEVIRRYADFILLIHSFEDALGRLPDARDKCRQRLEAVAPCLPEAVAARLRELIAAMPENRHLVHGDIHLKNVMMNGDEPIIIDMDTLSNGDPVFDYAGLFMTYIAFGELNPENSPAFHGISQETADRIFSDTLFLCLGRPDADTLQTALDKVRVLGYLRFLEVLTVEQKDLHSELKDRQIRRAVAQLAELTQRVKALTLAQ